MDFTPISDATHLSASFYVDSDRRPLPRSTSFAALRPPPRSPSTELPAELTVTVPGFED
jgi:hypothetical protein